MSSLKNTKAREMIDKFKHSSNSLIARRLFKENPVLFKDVECARDAIRYAKGKCGESKRGKNKDKTLFNMENKHVNQWGLPDEDHNDIAPYVIPKANKKVGVISDVHLPYQDNKALELTLNYLVEKEIDTLVLNGDIMDCYQVSSFVRDPGKRDLKYEIDITRNFLKSLRENFPNALIIFKEGNHSYRWKRFLMARAPEVFNMEEFRLDVILNLNSLGIIWVDNKRVIKAGKLNIIHGHEYNGAYSPVNPAKAYFNKAGTSVLAGHNHQSSEHISKNLNDEVTGAWSVGCLCELHPEYMTYNKWNLGFATVDIYKDGKFRVINKTIIDYKIM